MTTSVRTNQSAMIALQNLNATNDRLTATQSRVNTGLRVTGAKDNAAVWAIAQYQRSDLAALESVKGSLERGQSSVEVAMTAGTSIADLLKNMKSIAISASDKNLDQRSRDALEADFNATIGQIKQFIKNASFNGVNLLDGSTTAYRALANASGTAAITVPGENLKIPYESTAATAPAAVTAGAFTMPLDLTGGAATDITFTVLDDVKKTPVSVIIKKGASYTAADLVTEINKQLTAADSTISVASTGTAFRFTNTYTGADSRVTLTAQTGTATAGTLGVAAATASGTAATRTGGGGIITLGDSVKFSATYDYKLLVEDVETSLTNTNAALARLGAGAKSLDNHVTFISKLSDTVTAGVGNLVDADLAKESAALQALQVQQQLGVQALSIANQAPQILLSLFRGG